MFNGNGIKTFATNEQCIIHMHIFIPISNTWQLDLMTLQKDIGSGTRGGRGFQNFKNKYIHTLINLLTEENFSHSDQAEQLKKVE